MAATKKDSKKTEGREIFCDHKFLLKSNILSLSFVKTTYAKTETFLHHNSKFYVSSDSCLQGAISHKSPP